MQYNSSQLKNRRRELRDKQTKYEMVLWHELRNRRFLGLKFYRQYSVGSFILDFFCPKIRLAIEVDGQQHQMLSSQNYDGMRTQFLNENDIHVVRIKNDEIFYDLQGVLEKIEKAVCANVTPPDNPSVRLWRTPPLTLRGGKIKSG